MNAKQWLKANDPTYVSPQKRGAETRRRMILVDPRELGRYQENRQTTQKIGGVWKSSAPVGFSGDAENCRIEAIDHKASPERVVMLAEKIAEKPKRGKRGSGSKKHRGTIRAFRA